MPRKVILDVDPGIDDALALCLALFDPRLEVVAVTAVAGNVSPQVATRNVHAIIEQLDPPRLPRIGAASAPDVGPPVAERHLFGIDGLGNAEFQVAELRAMHPAEKIICDEVRAAPEEVTIVALGPLTNIARAFQRDPDLASLVNRVVMIGGAVGVSGNITPAAEFNTYFDPLSARTVFRSHSTKTLIPLDVTNKILLTFDFLNQVPSEETRVGRLLRKVLPPAYRVYRQEWGLEGIHAHDTVGLLAVSDPDLFTTQEMAGDVEIKGDLTRGATVFDRRRVPAWRCNMEVAVEVEVAQLHDQLLRNLANAGKASAG